MQCASEGCATAIYLMGVLILFWYLVVVGHGGGDR